MISVFEGHSDYPFNSEFFNPFSIYKLKAIYIPYTITFTLLLSPLIFLSIKRKWKRYFVLIELIFCFSFIIL
jgi:hypothetical protein